MLKVEYYNIQNCAQSISKKCIDKFPGSRPPGLIIGLNLYEE